MSLYKSYDDIKIAYEKLRQENIMKADEKRAEIYSRFPELSEIDQKIMHTFVNLVKSSDNDEKAEEYASLLEELRTSRIAFLKKNDIVDDYREVKHTCEKCKDTGFINGKKCSCFIEKEIELYDNVSNFRKYIADDNFSKLDMSYYKQKDLPYGESYYKYMEETIKNMKMSIMAIDKTPVNYLLIGMPGTGKTFLARSMGAEALKQNKSVLYLSSVEYIDSLKPDFDGVNLKKYAVLSDLLIIDDLGVEYSSEFSKTEINYIIDKRLNDKKSTIITTNLLIDELKSRYLPSMCSRLENLYINCYLSGNDLRRLKNANIK